MKWLWLRYAEVERQPAQLDRFAQAAEGEPQPHLVAVLVH